MCNFHTVGLLLISIHAPVWGATLSYNNILHCITRFQSTLPCGERPSQLCVAAFFPNVISIHAPVWGATFIVHFNPSHISISIHAPVWGATIIRVCLTEFSIISIHAPVWGATYRQYHQKQHYRISIHAPVWGATEDSLFVRHHEAIISIHAPVWGATEVVEDLSDKIDISIHAPVWGATANAHKPLASFQCRFDIFAQKKAKHPMFYLYSTTISCVFKTFFSAKVRCFLWALPLRTLSLSII